MASLSGPITGAMTVASCWAACTWARFAVATTLAASRARDSSSARGPKASSCSAPLVLTVTVTAPSGLAAFRRRTAGVDGHRAGAVGARGGRGDAFELSLRLSRAPGDFGHSGRRGFYSVHGDLGSREGHADQRQQTAFRFPHQLGNSPPEP